MFCFKCIRQGARRLGGQVDLKIKKTEPPFLSLRKGRLYDSPAAADGEHIDRYLSKGEVMIHLPQPSNAHKI